VSSLSFEKNEEQDVQLWYVYFERNMAIIYPARLIVK
jgi:hypothetical protein